MEEVSDLLGEIAEAMGMRKRDAKLQDKKSFRSQNYNNACSQSSQDSD